MKFKWLNTASRASMPETPRCLSGVAVSCSCRLAAFWAVRLQKRGGKAAEYATSNPSRLQARLEVGTSFSNP